MNAPKTFEEWFEQNVESLDYSCNEGDFRKCWEAAREALWAQLRTDYKGEVINNA